MTKSLFSFLYVSIVIWEVTTWLVFQGRAYKNNDRCPLLLLFFYICTVYTFCLIVCSSLSHVHGLWLQFFGTWFFVFFPRISCLTSSPKFFVHKKLQIWSWLDLDWVGSKQLNSSKLNNKKFLIVDIKY